MKVLTKRFLVSDLFNVNTGSLVSKKRLSELADKNGVPRISVTTDDNGQIGHYADNKEISNVRYFRNFITVNFFGKVYYHPSKASVEMKVHVLTLKSGKELTREAGMYLVTVLRKTFDNGSYNYGNQLSSSKIKKGQYYVELPVTPAGEPDFEYMTMRIRELEAERIRELEAYLRVTGLDDTTLSASEAQALTQKVKWKKFRIGDLFDYRRGKESAPKKVPEGDIPLISETSSNNGFVRGASSTHVFPAKTITVSVNYAQTVFLQPKKFCASVNIIILVPKFDNVPDAALLYFVTLLRANNGVYDYNYKISKDRLMNTVLLVPVTSTGDPDFDYMQHYIRATEKQIINGVIEYKDRVIDETKKVVNG